MAALLIAAGCGSTSYDGPTYVWSDDGGCGVPLGYVGINETITADGGCFAASWCPLDSSPNCISLPLDGGVPTNLDGGGLDSSAPDASGVQVTGLDGAMMEASVDGTGVPDGNVVDGSALDGGDSAP